MTGMSANEAANMIAEQVQRATGEMDRVAGVARPHHRPPHLAQVNSVVEVAVGQAFQVVPEPERVERDAVLWRLAEPGFLRGLCEHPVPRQPGALVLVPVLSTWGVLGYAEYQYVKEFEKADVATRPPFFTHWMAQPMFEGPLLLSLAVVVSLVVLSALYGRPYLAQRRAQTIDEIAHRLENEMIVPVNALRAAMPPPNADGQLREVAGELQMAARRFDGAARHLAGSVEVVDRLGAAVDRLLAGLPDLEAHTSRLAGVGIEIAQSADMMAEQARPLTSMIVDVGKAADTADQAAATSERVLGQSIARLDEARTVMTTTAGHQEALAAAGQPLAAAATTIESAARGMDATVHALHKTSQALSDTIKEVNWLAMVSDGLRHADHGVPDVLRDPEWPAE
jgi:hypothetical protein